MSIDDLKDVGVLGNDAKLIKKKVKSESSSPIGVHRHMLDVKVYPVKCPCCGEMVSVPNTKVHINTYPIGATRAGYGRKSTKKKGVQVQSKMTETESY